MNNRQDGRGPVDDINLDGRGYPTGDDGIVWGTYDRRQAEIIRNALRTQRITCDLKERESGGVILHLLYIDDRKTTGDAVDFIWKDSSGLRLKPDWHYQDGEVNRSFEQWLGGI